LGPNLEQDGHVEQRQMAQAHDRIPPMQVANLPPAAATLGPFESALDADEPVALRWPLRPEDTYVGQVQWYLNNVVHSASPSEAVLRSSHKNRFLILLYRAAHHGSSGRTLAIFWMPSWDKLVLSSGQFRNRQAAQYRNYQDYRRIIHSQSLLFYKEDKDTTVTVVKGKDGHLFSESEW
jgi:hypothetical protein